MADYTSEYSFTIDGVSSDTYGVFVETLEPVPHAQQRYTTGITRKPYAIPDGVYNEIPYNIAFHKFYPSSLDDKELRLFLSKGGTLQLSTMEGIYFKILTMETQISQRADNKRIDYVLNLTLEPYRYGVNNNWITLTSGDTVANSGTIKAYPTIELTNPSGNIKITVNDVDYDLYSLEAGTAQNPKKYYIDRQRFIVYDDNYNLLVGKDNGRLPELDVGNNTISWTGTVEAVKLKTNWREI